MPRTSIYTLAYDYDHAEYRFVVGLAFKKLSEAENLAKKYREKRDIKIFKLFLDGKMKEIKK